MRPPQFANFSAYAYAPAILVTPLGAISIIVSAILADYFLQERLHICGLMGCFLCTIGSFVLVSYAPEEQVVTSVEQIWDMATQPIFLGYCACVVLLVSLLVFWSTQKTTSGTSYGETQVLLYVSICSLIGSLSVVSCKASASLAARPFASPLGPHTTARLSPATTLRRPPHRTSRRAVQALGIALKLTFRGINQLNKYETYVFAVVVVICVVGQMNYLNKALDTFNTAMVSSVYYIFFTICTITASMIMYKDWENQTATSISWQLLGFMMIIFGVYSLNSTQGLKDTQPGCAAGARAICGACLPEDYARRLTRKRVELERVVLLAGGEDGDESEGEGEGEAPTRLDGREPALDPGGRSRSQPQPPTVSPFDIGQMCRSNSAQVLHGEARR